MEVPFFELKYQYATIREEILEAVGRIFESQRFVLGAEVKALEEEIARLCDVPFAVGVASGSDALLLSLKALGIGPGDSVVTVPYSFFATAGAIVHAGARPLFVDIDEATFNMDPERLSALFARECNYNLTTQKLVHRASDTAVRAIIPVHLYGQCADMKEILEISLRYGLPVVEDACQALGARYGPSMTGSMGDLGCFSFFPSKNLGGAGDGGMVVTRSPELADRVRLLRTHGAEPKYYHEIVGYNSRLDEVQAAVLRVKLRHLDAWMQARARNAAGYESDFQAAGLRTAITLPSVRPDRSHVFHQYVVRSRERDELRKFLAGRGVGTEIYYPLSLHEQKCFRHLGYGGGDFPRSRAAAQQTLALPVYPELTQEQRRYVVDSFAAFHDREGRERA